MLPYPAFSLRQSCELFAWLTLTCNPPNLGSHVSKTISVNRHHHLIHFGEQNLSVLLFSHISLGGTTQWSSCQNCLLLASTTSQHQLYQWVCWPHGGPGLVMWLGPWKHLAFLVIIRSGSCDPGGLCIYFGIIKKKTALLWLTSGLAGHSQSRVFLCGIVSQRKQVWNLFMLLPGPLFKRSSPTCQNQQQS
jgi:hypothetical protein